MSRRIPWPDGLRDRIALILLAALLLQFVGGELIFHHVETSRVERDRAERLAERLAVAERLLMRLPPGARAQTAGELWRSPLTIGWQPEAPPEARRGSRRDGVALEGAVALPDGSWMQFRSADHFAVVSLWHHYLASVLLLLACAVLVSLLFARMIGRPLRALARAADAVGRDEPVTIAAEGPREVRQVAIAFDAMQTRLYALVRERMQSLAAVSHDLRTPLARMRLHAATVGEEETRAAIEQDVREMEAFVGSVLDYLRGDDPEPARLADVASILLTIVDDARDLGGQVTFEGPGRLEAFTRPMKLKRAVDNLVQNAVRHGGATRLTLREEQEALIITVDDDGPGIPEDRLEAVLEPFYRLDASRNRSAGGAGLGLAIARRLVGRLEGTLTLRNRAEGGLRAVIKLKGRGIADHGSHDHRVTLVQ